MLGDDRRGTWSLDSHGSLGTMVSERTRSTSLRVRPEPVEGRSESNPWVSPPMERASPRMTMASERRGYSTVVVR